MSRESLAALVSRLEVAWRDRPERLLRRTLRYAIVGYVLFVSSWLVGVAAIGVGSTFLMVDSIRFPSVAAGLLISLGIIWLLLTYSCLRPGRFSPRGILLNPSEAPELFRLLHELCQSAPPPERVYLTAELNSSIIHPARLGVFGWHRNWLTIGLPLLHTLPHDELRAVLAHEVAHISPIENPIHHWLQRTRRTWALVAERSENHAARPLFNWIFRWLGPRVQAPALILSRRHELACDRFAARLTSPHTLASALKRLAIARSRVQDLHDDWLEDRLKSEDTPPSDYVETVLATLASPYPPASALECLGEALNSPSDPTDTHPRLAERLRHLNSTSLPPELPSPALPSAASRLIPAPLLQEIPAKLSASWRESQRSHWQASHRKRRENLARSRSRQIRQSWKRIASLSRLDGLAAMQPEILRLLAEQPNHSGALYLRGTYLADQNDPAAVRFLEASAEDPTLTRQAFETLSRYHFARNRQDLAIPLRKRLEQHEVELRAALIERNHSSPSDTFLPHELSHEELEVLRSILSEIPAIQRAWLVRKHVRHFPHWRCYLLCLDVRWPAFSPSHSLERLTAQLLEEWDIEGFVLPLIENESNRPTIRSLRRAVADAEIFRCR